MSPHLLAKVLDLITARGVAENLVAGFLAIGIQLAIAFCWRLLVARRVLAKNSNLSGLWISEYHPTDEPDRTALEVLWLRHRGHEVVVGNWYYHSGFYDVYSYVGQGVVTDTKFSAYVYGTQENNLSESSCYALRFEGGRLIGGVMQYSLFASEDYALRTRLTHTFYGYQIPIKQRIRLWTRRAPFGCFADAKRFIATARDEGRLRHADTLELSPRRTSFISVDSASSASKPDDE